MKPADAMTRLVAPQTDMPDALAYQVLPLGEKLAKRLASFGFSADTARYAHACGEGKAAAMPGLYFSRSFGRDTLVVRAERSQTSFKVEPASTVDFYWQRTVGAAVAPVGQMPAAQATDLAALELPNLVQQAISADKASRAVAVKPLGKHALR